MFNLVKTAILMAAITALFIVIGGILGGREGVVMALLFALAMNFFSYWYSDQLVLRMTNAQEVDEHSAPQFYAMVQELAAQAARQHVLVQGQRFTDLISLLTQHHQKSVNTDWA